MDTGPAWAWFMWVLTVSAMFVGLIWFGYWFDRFQERHRKLYEGTVNKSQDLRDE